MNFYYWVEGEVIGLATSTNNGKTFAKVTTGSADNFVVFCTKKATHFGSDLTEISEIPSQFHQALVDKVIAGGYKKPGKDLQLAQAFDAMYIELVNEAKKYAKGDRHRFGRIIPTDF